MKAIKLLLKTRTSDSLKRFLDFFDENINKNFSCVTKVSNKNQKKIIFSILKSPHVNKAAQEQFETIFLLKQLEISSTQILKFLIFLKKIKDSLFSDIDFKIKLLTDNKKLLSKYKKLSLKKRVTNFENFSNDFFFEKKTFISNKKLNVEQKKNQYANVFNRDFDSVYLLKLIDFYGL